MIGPDRSRARPGFSGRTRHRLMFATEPARAVFDAGSLLAGQALLRQAPRGEPHPVLVLPGLLASDVSTMGLRRWIRRLGYPVRGWELGRNRGPTQAVVDGLPLLVDQLAQRYGQAVSVVGWSLGGIFARRMALNRPETIRQVITLGTPGSGSTSGWPICTSSSPAASRWRPCADPFRCRAHRSTRAGTASSTGATASRPSARTARTSPSGPVTWGSASIRACTGSSPTGWLNPSPVGSPSGGRCESR